MTEFVTARNANLGADQTIRVPREALRHLGASGWAEVEDAPDPALAVPEEYLEDTAGDAVVGDTEPVVGSEGVGDTGSSHEAADEEPAAGDER